MLSFRFARFARGHHISCAVESQRRYVAGECDRMDDRVIEAVLENFRSLPGVVPLRQDLPTYTLTPTANLVSSLTATILDDFASGSGGELDGDAPKFCAVHSSSALAANSFGPMRLHPEFFELAGLRDFTESCFEQKLPTGLLGTPPNLDFFATGLFGTVAVESKFTEILSSKTAKFSPAYDGAVARLAEASWRSMYESLLSDPKRFGKLDAAQLVKHYLGMRHSLTDEPGENVLMYVFWEPLNATDLPEFSSHRSEVDHFAAEVADSAVRFVSLSHSELWTAWEASCEWPHLPEHIGALRARYEVNVRPPAA